MYMRWRKKLQNIIPTAADAGRLHGNCQRVSKHTACVEDSAIHCDPCHNGTLGCY